MSTFGMECTDNSRADVFGFDGLLGIAQGLGNAQSLTGLIEMVKYRFSELRFKKILIDFNIYLQF